MLIALKLQLKNIMRDKFVLVSILLPVVLAIVLKSYTPNVVIESQVAILKDNLTDTTINQIESVAVVEQYSDMTQLRNRILDTKNEVVGIVFDDGAGYFEFMLQGNETTRTKTGVQILAGLINGEITVAEIQTELLTNDNNDIYYFLMTLTILIALFMGCTFNAFNIVAEKEEGITNIKRILPITLNKDILHKTILGFIGTVVVTLTTISIVLESDIKWWVIILFVLVSSFAVSILGLFLGSISKNLISIIVNTKVILLLFIFIPAIGFIMPADLEFIRTIFYLIPSFPMFEGLWAILKDGNIIEMFINTGIVGVQAMLAYLLYLLFLKKGQR